MLAKKIIPLLLFLIIILNSCTKNFSLFHSKSQWLKSFFEELENYDDIYAVSHWNEDFDNTYLTVNSSKKSLKTFKSLINSEKYISTCNFKNGKLVPSYKKKYFASFPNFCGEEDCVSEKKITEYENLIEKDIAWAYFSNNWNDSIVFPYNEVIEIFNAGKIPFIRMMPRSEFEEGQIDPVWNLKDIISGKFNTQIIAWANEAKNINKELLVEFGTEVNGAWFAWNGSYYGKGVKNNYGDNNYPDGAEIFRDAYRHIIDLCNNAEANNITWFFHFDVNNEPEEWWNKPQYYYPGDEYIDWLGVSIYGPTEKGDKYKDLKANDLIKKAHKTFKDISQNKPYSILEFGVTEF